MKVPKRIEVALERRASAAKSFHSYDRVITDFVNENGIVVDPADYCGGVESISNPDESSKAVYEAILNHSNT